MGNPIQRARRLHGLVLSWRDDYRWRELPTPKREQDAIDEFFWGRRDSTPNP